MIDEGTQRAVYLPPGEWVDYWTGKGDPGGRVVVADAPPDTIPVWARAGAVIAKIPEDVMTLVPPSESGNTAVKSLDDRRVYEVIGGGAGQTAVTDFEGRALVRTAHSLKINGGTGGAHYRALAVWHGRRRHRQRRGSSSPERRGRAVCRLRVCRRKHGGVAVEPAQLLPCFLPVLLQIN